jgi:hypothetical protein
VRQIAVMETSISTKAPLNSAVGDRALCAWQPGRGLVWVQTRDPKHARRLAQRSDGKLVAYAVAGGYLKTFEFQRSLAWSMRLIKRYTANQTATNAALNPAICPVASRTAGRGRSALDVI